MENPRSSETPVPIYRKARRHIPEDPHLSMLVYLEAPIDLKLCSKGVQVHDLREPHFQQPSNNKLSACRSVLPERLTVPFLLNPPPPACTSPLPHTYHTPHPPLCSWFYRRSKILWHQVISSSHRSPRPSLALIPSPAPCSRTPSAYCEPAYPYILVNLFPSTKPTKCTHNIHTSYCVCCVRIWLL